MQCRVTIILSTIVHTVLNITFYFKKIITLWEILMLLYIHHETFLCINYPKLIWLVDVAIVSQLSDTSKLLWAFKFCNKWFLRISCPVFCCVLDLCPLDLLTWISFRPAFSTLGQTSFRWDFYLHFLSPSVWVCCHSSVMSADNAENLCISSFLLITAVTQG